MLTGTMEVSSKAKGEKAQAQLSGSVKVIPLGGLDQIGMNITAIETEDTMIIVDCGLAFLTDDISWELIWLSGYQLHQVQDS